MYGFSYELLHSWFCKRANMDAWECSMSSDHAGHFEAMSFRADERRGFVTPDCPFIERGKMKARCLLLLLVICVFFIVSCGASTQASDLPSVTPMPTVHDDVLVAQLKATKVQNGTKAFPYIIQGKRQAFLDFSCPDWLVDQASVASDPWCISHQSASRLKANVYFILIESVPVAVLFQVADVYPQQKEVVAFLSRCVTSLCS
jgi:hypothetical protein